MAKELEKRGNDIVTPGFNTLENFEMSMRAAKLLAASSLVPKQFQGDISNCVIALNMAQRMNADPFMVMQNLYVVHNNPSFSSKFLIATFNSSGKFSSLRYDFQGKEGKNDWSCTAWAIEKETGEKLIGTKVSIQMAVDEGWYGKTGSKWKTMPQQMLMYRAASFFIKTYAPEISCGMQSSEEMEDVTNSINKDISIEQEIKENANTEIIDIEETEITNEETGEIIEEPKNEPTQAEKEVIIAAEKAENEDDSF